MKKKLIEILSEQGYTTDERPMDHFDLSQDRDRRGKGWHYGEIIYVPWRMEKRHTIERQTYHVWNGRGVSLKSLFEKPLLLLANSNKVDGAVQAYRSLERDCLVVPKRNHDGDTIGDVVYEIYLP